MLLCRFLFFCGARRCRARVIAAVNPAMALSLLVGAKPLPASVIADALFGTCQSADCTIVLDARLPRTPPDYLPVAHWGLRGTYANPHPQPAG